jgi:hypothetical protein
MEGKFQEKNRNRTKKTIHINENIKISYIPYNHIIRILRSEKKDIDEIKLNSIRISYFLNSFSNLKIETSLLENFFGNYLNAYRIYYQDTSYGFGYISFRNLIVDLESPDRLSFAILEKSNANISLFKFDLKCVQRYFYISSQLEGKNIYEFYYDSMNINVKEFWEIYSLIRFFYDILDIDQYIKNEKQNYKNWIEEISLETPGGRENRIKIQTERNEKMRK